MAARRRVSVKGRGADIFFGDIAAPVAEGAEGSSDTPPGQESMQESKEASMQESEKESTHASKQASMQEGAAAGEWGHTPPNQTPEVGGVRDRLLPAQASMQESEKESTHASKQASMQEGEPAFGETLAALWPLVAEPATITNAFRYTERELAALTDALYQVTRRHKVRLSKQDIARLGLNLILWDYQARGERSLLVALAEKKKAVRG